MGWQEQELEKRLKEKVKRDEEQTLRLLENSTLTAFWQRLCDYNSQLPSELRLSITIDNETNNPWLKGKGFLIFEINSIQSYPRMTYYNGGSGKGYGKIFEIIFDRKQRCIAGRHGSVDAMGRLDSDYCDVEIFEVTSSKGVETIVKNVCTGMWMADGLKLLKRSKGSKVKRSFFEHLFGN